MIRLIVPRCKEKHQHSLHSYYSCVGAFELASKRSPWYQSTLYCMYEVTYMQLPSLAYLVFASNGVGKGLIVPCFQALNRKYNDQ